MTTPDVPRDDSTRDDTVRDTTPSTAEPQRDALADEVFDDRTREVPTWATTPDAPGTTATAVRPATGTATAAPAAPAAPPREYVKGPAPFAVVLGLLGLVVAAVTLFTEIVGLDIPWGDLGPWSVVGAGVLVLLVGGLGLRASRGQD